MRNKIQIAIFLLVLATVISSLSFACYKALSSIFYVSTGGAGTAWIGWTFAGLSFGFIGSLIVGGKFYNWFTRAWYWSESVWMGLFCYLSFASIVYLIVPIAIFGKTLVAIALFAGIYGVINARSITIKNVRVRLPNLPSSWIGKRAVWISDIHLGQIYGRSYMEKIVGKINGLAPEIVFIGGDLFDGSSHPKIIESASPLAGLRSSRGTFFVTGNHEEFGDASPFLDKVRSLGICILDDEKIELDGLQIVGVDHEKASKRADFEAILARIAIDRTKPSILLKHEPRDLDVAFAAGISLQISGHVHRGQQWPFEYVAKLMYKGYTYGLKTLGAMNVYVSSGVGTWGPPVRVGSQCEIVAFDFE